MLLQGRRANILSPFYPLIDPFQGGSLRLLFSRLQRAGLFTYPKLRELLLSSRWDQHQIDEAEDCLQQLPLEMVDAYHGLALQASDLNLNDGRSRYSTPRILQERVLDMMQPGLEHGNPYREEWIRHEREAAEGHVAVEGKVITFTRGGGTLREPEWTQSLGPLGELDSLVEPSSQPSGTGLSPDRNNMNQSEVAFPFVHVPQLPASMLKPEEHAHMVAFSREHRWLVFLLHDGFCCGGVQQWEGQEISLIPCL